MEIRTKHLGAGFKEGARFWSSKRRKKDARKIGLPQYVCACAEVGSADWKCASSCNSHSDVQRFSERKTMEQAYVEGVGVDGAFLASRGTSGFDGLRLLAREFSLRSRAEASFFRIEFLAKTCKASSGLTQVSDIIRQIDVGLSRFRKMIETLPAAVSRVGLEVQTSDLTIMLLRSLTHDVRSYATLHAAAQ